MPAQTNAAPVIIKRKKIVVAGGHHGGAWKVAYADFVTAMMAFFLLMWLLNATTEKQRKGISDYFNPTIPINRISGGGDGAFGGDSVFAEDTLSQSGTGSVAHTGAEPAANADGKSSSRDSGEADGMSNNLDEVEKALLARSGESATMERLMKHVVTRVTDEGLVIEIFDLPDAPLFDEDTSTPTPETMDIAQLIAEVLALTTNEIAINGYLRSYPVTLIDNPVWALSVDRAQKLRLLLEEAGLVTDRMQRVTGSADRKPATADPQSARNNRLEIILLRRDR